MSNPEMLYATKISMRRWLDYAKSAVLQKSSSLVWRLRKINDRMIVFDAYNATKYTDSPRVLYEAMLADKRFSKYTFIWALGDVNDYPELHTQPRTQVVKFDSHEYRRAYATAKYWVVNAMIPLSLAKRPGKQIMLQCWHGTPLKRLRNDVIDNRAVVLDSLKDIQRKNNLDTSRYDFFISPSGYATRHFNSAFHLKELGKQGIILETGYPRNDYLVNYQPTDTDRVKRRLGLPLDKTVLLYAPTWRDDQYNPEVGYVGTLKLDLTALQKSVGDSYVVLIRLHYSVADTLDLSAYLGFAYNVSHEADINELYIISDVLMTDYSSVFFDYANLKRPVLFYMYDQDHYEHELRGFYISPAKLPGDIVTTQAGIVSRLQNLPAYRKRTRKAVTAFHAEFNYLDDGQATRRVIDAVWPKP